MTPAELGLQEAGLYAARHVLDNKWWSSSFLYGAIERASLERGCPITPTKPQHFEIAAWDCDRKQIGLSSIIKASVHIEFKYKAEDVTE